MSTEAMTASEESSAPEGADHRPDPGRSLAGLARRACVDVGILTGIFFVALFGFIVCVTLFSVGVGTAVIVVGLVVLTAALVVAGGFARFHRMLLSYAGIEITPTVYPARRPGFRGLLRRLGHAQSWRELLHVLVVFVVGTATFVIGVTWFFAGPGGLTYALWSIWLPDQGGQGLAWLLGFPGRWAETLTNTALGLVFLLTAPVVLRGLVRLHGGIARALLDDEAGRLRQQVSTLTTSRAAAGEAEAATLRRLERDLHDGPQQRLVRLGMDISAIQRRMTTDPEAAQRMLDEALVQSQEALAEIRMLSRGIAPPILTEQGLRGAVVSLAARSTVPISVDVPDDLDLSDPAQNAAYFVVAEGLVNLAKHSGATSGQVEISRIGALVAITVSDDGVGGASPAKGHGLSGLRDRLAGVDGSLTVSSPEGGPTQLTATLPASTHSAR